MPYYYNLNLIWLILMASCFIELWRHAGCVWFNLKKAGRRHQVRKQWRHNAPWRQRCGQWYGYGGFLVSLNLKINIIFDADTISRTPPSGEEAMSTWCSMSPKRWTMLWILGGSCLLSWRRIYLFSNFRIFHILVISSGNYLVVLKKTNCFFVISLPG